MAKAKLHAGDGAFKSEFDLPASHFDQEINEAVLYTAVNIYLGNQRQGTHKAKNRSEVSGGGKKPWKQKGTGRARQGSNTAPNWARGGKAHGPLPRLYRRDINRKVKRIALLSALSAKAKDQGIFVFENLALPAPKTKELVKVLKAAALEGQKNLILVSDPDRNLQLAARNIPNVLVQRVADINSYNLVNATNVIFTDAALKSLVAGPDGNGQEEAAPEAKPAKPRAKAKPAAGAPAKTAAPAKAKAPRAKAGGEEKP